MEMVDLIIKTQHMYTMSGDSLGYEYEKSVVIDKGKILEIDTHEKIKESYDARNVINAIDKLVLPGFIDGHVHSQHAIIRGVAQDIGNWMMDGVAPFELNKTRYSKILGSKLAVYEAIHNGTTTICDDGLDMEDSCKIISQAGVRGCISVRIRDAVSRVYKPGELYEYDSTLGLKQIEECLQLHDKWNGHDNGRIEIRFGPQGPDFVCRDNLIKIKEIANKRKMKIHMHLQQGERETKQMMLRYGKRSIPWLNELDYFNEDFIGIHLTNATESEVAFVASKKASMILCSGSIGIIDGIVPPAKEFIDARGYVGLGSDQAAGNNCHNIINEMKLTALFNKIKYQDPEVMPAWKVLRMATIEGAKALGIDGVTGSIECGKAADIIMIDLNSATMQPVFTNPMRNFVPNLVYSANGSEIDTVIVAGNIIVESKKSKTFDIDSLLDEISNEAIRIGEASNDKFWDINGMNAQYMREKNL